VIVEKGAIVMVHPHGERPLVSSPLGVSPVHNVAIGFRAVAPNDCNPLDRCACMRVLLRMLLR
jgi:hypothetical protein